MIFDSVLVCHFERDASRLPTVNRKVAEQFLWIFLAPSKPLKMLWGERWLEVQCEASISQKEVDSLNTKMGESIASAVADYDALSHCKIYLKIMYELGRLAEGVAQILSVRDSTMCHGVASELPTNIEQFAGHTLPQKLELYRSATANWNLCHKINQRTLWFSSDIIM